MVYPNSNSDAMYKFVYYKLNLFNASNFKHFLKPVLKSKRVIFSENYVPTYLCFHFQAEFHTVAWVEMWQSISEGRHLSATEAHYVAET